MSWNPLTWLEDGAGAPGSFLNNSLLHIEGGAWLTLLCLLHTKPGHWWITLSVATLIAAGKEFWYDMRYENPPQAMGSIKGRGALNDFVAYVVGILVGVVSWLV